MHSISRVVARTRLCHLPKGLVVVRHASDDNVVYVNVKELSLAQREKLEREKKKAHIAAERERVMGEKKTEVVVDRKVDRQLFEKLIMNLVEKHLEEKITARERQEEPDIQPQKVKFTEDEKEYLASMRPGDSDSLTPEKGENDDDFWERKALANLPRYDYLDPKLKPRNKPGRDYQKIAEKMHLATLGDPDKTPYYMRYNNQPTFLDEKKDIFVDTTNPEDIKDNEMAIKQEDKRDGSDYANNIEKMYNRVQKFKQRRSLEEEAMGIKPVQSPVMNSRFKDKFLIKAAVILERYPTLTPPLKQHEVEHEQWEQAIRLQTCVPVIPWYIWKMEWEKLTEAQKQERMHKGISASGGGGGGGGKADKKKKGDKPVPPDFGLPHVKMPELSEEDAVEQQKIEARRLKPYNDWMEYWKNWQAAPRETEDDLKDNRKSINRALHKKLYLIIKKKNKDTWEFPSVLNTEEETIRLSAERSLTENLGRDMTVYFHSNAPVGFYNNYFSSAQEQESHQAEMDKMFFMRARYFSGTPDPMRRAGNVDYLWVTREQLNEYLPKDYHDRVINFIWPDPN